MEQFGDFAVAEEDLLCFDEGNGLAPSEEVWRKLYFAVLSGNVEAVKAVLLQGVDINGQDKDGWTVLHLACQEQHLVIVNELLAYGATDVLDNTGMSPLHVAAATGNAAIAQALLNKGADCEAARKDGWSPLHVASHFDSDNVIQVVLDAGAYVDQQDRYGQTPLHVAAYKGSRRAVVKLVENDATKDMQDNYGDRPVDKALNGDVKKLLKVKETKLAKEAARQDFGANAPASRGGTAQNGSNDEKNVNKLKQEMSSFAITASEPHENGTEQPQEQAVPNAMRKPQMGNMDGGRPKPSTGIIMPTLRPTGALRPKPPEPKVNGSAPGSLEMKLRPTPKKEAPVQRQATPIRTGLRSTPVMHTGAPQSRPAPPPPRSSSAEELSQQTLFAKPKQTPPPESALPPAQRTITPPKDHQPVHVKKGIHRDVPLDGHKHKKSRRAKSSIISSKNKTLKKTKRKQRKDKAGGVPKANPAPFRSPPPNRKSVPNKRALRQTTQPLSHHQKVNSLHRSNTSAPHPGANVAPLPQRRTPFKMGFHRDGDDVPGAPPPHRGGLSKSMAPISRITTRSADREFHPPMPSEPPQQPITPPQPPGVHRPVPNRPVNPVPPKHNSALANGLKRLLSDGSMKSGGSDSSSAASGLRSPPPGPLPSHAPAPIPKKPAPMLGQPPVTGATPAPPSAIATPPTTFPPPTGEMPKPASPGSPPPKKPDVPMVENPKDENERLILAIQTSHYAGVVDALQKGAKLDCSYKGHKPGWYAQQQDDKTISLLIKIQLALYEIVTSERTFVDKLVFTVMEILKPLNNPKSKILRQEEVRIIFMNLEQILLFNQNLLAQFEKAWNTGVKERVQSMAKVFTEPGLINYLKVYNDYSSQYMDATTTFKKLKKSKPKFAKFLDEKKAKNQYKLPLDSLLAEPFQRLPRYEMLLKELLKRFDDTDDTHHKLKEAWHKIAELNIEINTKQTEKENLSQWTQKLRGHLNLMEATRRFSYHGTADLYDPRTKAVSRKGVHLILFNDYLIITQNDDNEVVALLYLLFVDVSSLDEGQAMNKDKSFRIYYEMQRSSYYLDSTHKAIWIDKLTQCCTALHESQTTVSIKKFVPKAGKSVPTNRFLHSVTQVGDKFFIIGGECIGASNSVESRSDMQHMIDALPERNAEILDIVGCFSVSKSGVQSWQKIIKAGGKIGQLIGHTGALMRDNKTIFLYGGHIKDHPGAYYSVSKNKFMDAKFKSEKTPCPSRFLHTCTHIGDNLIFLGGLTLKGEPVPLYKQIHVLNMDKNKPDASVWLTFKNTEVHKWDDKKCVFGHSATAAGTKILVFGGCTGFDANQVTNTLAILDTTTWKWEELVTVGPAPTPRFSHAAALVNGQLLIHGGMSPSGELLNDTYILNIGDKTWMKCHQKGNVARAFHHALCVGSRVMCFGGIRSDMAENFDVFEIDTSFVRSLPKELRDTVDKAARQQRVAQQKNEMDLAKWSQEDVQTWLEMIMKMPEYKKTFRKAAVDGTKLLAMTELLLEKELKVKSALHRQNIMKVVEENRAKVFAMLRENRFKKPGTTPS